MPKSDIAQQLPLHKRIMAVAVSAVMVMTLCPLAQALADTTDNAKAKAAAASSSDDSTQSGLEGLSGKTAVSAVADEATAVVSEKVSRGIIDNEFDDESYKLDESGIYGFALFKGDTLIKGPIFLEDGTSFGEVDFNTAGLNIRVVNGLTDEYLDSADYEANFSKARTNSVGTKTITVTGKGSYSGTLHFTFTVGGKISDAKVSTSFKNGGYYAYTGGRIAPGLTLKLGESTLKAGTDYELEYSTDKKNWTTGGLVSGNSKDGVAYVRAVSKDPAFTGQTGAYKFHIVGLKYNSYGQGKWKGWANLGQTSGAGSGTKKVGCVKVVKTNSALSGDISYSVLNDKKWKSSKNGGTAGVSGQAAQTMKFSLSGKLKDHFDIYYRVCVSGAGWMAWAKNGSYAGVKNFHSKMKITGYQVKLVEKSGGSRPANASLSTVYASNWDSFAKDILYSRIKNKSSKSSYTISVDTTFNRLAIYKGSKGKWKLVKYWVCGTGIKSRPTTKGDFTLKSRNARIDSGKISYYNFHGYGGSLGFHSVTCKVYTKKLSKPISKQLGKNISHGCVRVSMKNSKYIYKLPNGTSVAIRGLV
ncbi:MAG: L,D-transpeptidase [Coriobacteriia bacterium]|nr:L,D-transpeptidase [Coriobacteriia bacterium]